MIKDRRKRIKKTVSQLCLFDDDFSQVALRKIECVEYILRIIIGMIIHLDESFVQHMIKNLEGRSARLDIFAYDENGIYFDIEIENKKHRADIKRARFHSGLIDSYVSEPSEDWKNVREIYVIFITARDMFNEGKPIYHVERTLEDGYEMNDKEHIIYVNGEYEGDDDIGRLMHDMKCTDVEKMNEGVLKERVKALKEGSEVENEMCELIEKLVRELADEEVAAAREEAKKEAKMEAKKEAKMEAKKEAEEAAREAVREAAEKATYQERKSFALYMVECGETYDRIVEKTHLTLEQVKELVV